MGRELVARNATSALNLREIAARTTLRSVRLQGHVYVELRQVGKRPIYFCTLCQTPCFNDNVLFDHLKGNLHSRRYAAAKITLFGPIPWPFSDGVLFFNSDKEMSGCENGSCDGGGIVIPRILVKERVKSLKARLIGVGHVGARVEERNEGRGRISRIWCAWLGKGDSDDCAELVSSPECEFAVVSFPYTVELGRRGFTDEAGSFFAIDDSGNRRKKRKKSFSDTEDSAIVCSAKDSRLVVSKTARRELRKDKRRDADRTCDICGQAMLVGKDVATLLNCKTGKVACSSRNVNGAFHIFHASCLVHWILFCEFETWTNQPISTKPRRGRKAKLPQKSLIVSPFCPECQGTGVHIKGEELEKPTIALSEVFLYKLKSIEAQKAWMKNPEILQKCSTGLHFPSDSTEKLQEKVIAMKVLQFYRADE